MRQLKMRIIKFVEEAFTWRDAFGESRPSSFAQAFDDNGRTLVHVCRYDRRDQRRCGPTSPPDGLFSIPYQPAECHMGFIR
jgi:hypothetical protein